MRFRKAGILLYGNVKFAYKQLSRDTGELAKAVETLNPIDEQVFTSRHLPIYPVKPIAPEKAYLTGYLIEAEINRELEENPKDETYLSLRSEREQVIEDALNNYHAYLGSDHLDVYVATSMRDRHEFSQIAALTKSIFDYKLLERLNVRWFDPTQAYCTNRVDKGLAEALMLRRSACTLYLAQESDTLGKDSELASTLAQGKPVIAYIPEFNEEWFQNHLRALKEAYPDKDFNKILLSQIQIYDSSLAWSDPQVRMWIEGKQDIDTDELTCKLGTTIERTYNKRAKTLQDAHPLGIQVHLDSGVANGVLVARSPRVCAELIRAILLEELEFNIDESGDSYIALREKISGCIFRVVTRDQLLTNTFWNFYTDPVE